MQRTLLLAVTVSVLLVPAWSTAEIFQWTDTRGVVHFTDTRPEGVKPSRLETSDLPEARVVQTRSSGDFRYSPKRYSPKKDAASQTNPSTSEASARARACAEVEADIEHVQSQLRAGYGEPGGNRLRAKRRALRTRYSEVCR